MDAADPGGHRAEVHHPPRAHGVAGWVRGAGQRRRPPFSLPLPNSPYNSSVVSSLLSRIPPAPRSHAQGGFPGPSLELNFWQRRYNNLRDIVHQMGSERVRNGDGTGRAPQLVHWQDCADWRSRFLLYTAGGKGPVHICWHGRWSGQQPLGCVAGEHLSITRVPTRVGTPNGRQPFRASARRAPGDAVLSPISCVRIGRVCLSVGSPSGTCTSCAACK